VPDSILSAVPTGDMHDGRIDEEVFGASYDFVELFLRAKREPAIAEAVALEFNVESRERFGLLSGRIEELHSYNKHKYLGRSPAVHFDLFDCDIPNGWRYHVYSTDEAKVVPFKAAA
jgi:NH3-dependent NAD+ synthetase